MNKNQQPAAQKRPTRRTTAVIAQYIQDLSQATRVRGPRQPADAHEPRVFPARVVPLPCS